MEEKDVKPPEVAIVIRLAKRFNLPVAAVLRIIIYSFVATPRRIVEEELPY
jgi:hypothetical protein